MAMIAVGAVHQTVSLFTSSPAILANAAAACNGTCTGIEVIVFGVVWKYLGSSIDDTNCKFLKFDSLLFVRSNERMLSMNETY